MRQEKRVRREEEGTGRGRERVGRRMIRKEEEEEEGHGSRSVCVLTGGDVPWRLWGRRQVLVTLGQCPPGSAWTSDSFPVSPPNLAWALPSVGGRCDFRAVRACRVGALPGEQEQALGAWGCWPSTRGMRAAVSPPHPPRLVELWGDEHPQPKDQVTSEEGPHLGSSRGRRRWQGTFRGRRRARGSGDPGGWVRSTGVSREGLEQSLRGGRGGLLPGGWKGTVYGPGKEQLSRCPSASPAPLAQEDTHPRCRLPPAPRSTWPPPQPAGSSQGCPEPCSRRAHAVPSACLESPCSGGTAP